MKRSSSGSRRALAFASAAVFELPRRRGGCVDLGVEQGDRRNGRIRPQGPNIEFLKAPERQRCDPEKILLALDSKDGRIVVKGWRESTDYTAEDVIRQLEPYCGGFLCTYVDKEGMMQGTDLDWFRRLRAATSTRSRRRAESRRSTTSGPLNHMQIHSALGMAIYTGRLNLKDLEAFASL